MSAKIAVPFAFLVVFSSVLHAQTTTQTNAVGTAVSNASTAGGSAVTAAGSGLFTSTSAPINVMSTTSSFGGTGLVPVPVTPGISFGGKSGGSGGGTGGGTAPVQRRDNVSHNLDFSTRGDLVDRPMPADIRIQQPGVGVPRCFDASRDGQSC